jgi:hypothetical protein
MWHAPDSSCRKKARQASAPLSAAMHAARVGDADACRLVVREHLVKSLGNAPMPRAAGRDVQLVALRRGTGGVRGRAVAAAAHSGDSEQKHEAKSMNAHTRPTDESRIPSLRVFANEMGSLKSIQMSMA